MSRRANLRLMVFLGAMPFACCVAGQAPEPCPLFTEESPDADAPRRTITVRALRFKGARRLPMGVRNGLTARIRQYQFDAETSWLEKLKEDIRGTYQEHGFINARVEASFHTVNQDSQHGVVDVTARVKEGLQYRLQELRFANEDRNTRSLVFTAAELRSLFPIRDDDILQVGKVLEGFKALARLYGSRGYIDIVPEPSFEPDDARQEMVLTIFLVEGRAYRIERIEFLGLSAETKAVLERNSRLAPGGILDYSLLEELFTKNRLLLPPGASARNVSVTRNPAAGTVTLVFDFRACKNFWSGK